MAARAILTYLGMLVLGFVLLAVGALIEPPRTAANPISESGESLIALGLTLIFIAIGFMLVRAAPS